MQFIHPISADRIEGVRILPEDKLQSSDVYDSTSGKWEKCPCPGLVLQKGSGEGNPIIWVRPTAQ